MAPKLLAFMKYPFELREYLYTNNRVESMNKLLKLNSKKHEQFTSVDSLEKFLVPIFNNYNSQERRINNYDLIEELFK